MELPVIQTENGTAYPYQYRTLSVEHLPQLQTDIDQLRSSGRLSSLPYYQEILDHRNFTPPDDFPTARSILILAVFNPLLMINIQYQGAKIPAILPPTYPDIGMTPAVLEKAIRQQILTAPGYRLEKVEHFYHKRLAARSGLAQYGRNNICYVEGLGSFIELHTYLTDYPFETDSWQEVQNMERCEKCRICRNHCPTGAVRENDFAIDAGRCLTLYNEAPGDFPEWMAPDIHHALIGCIKCQAPCPANREVMQKMHQAEDITEEETAQILSGNPDKKVRASASKKTRAPYLFSDGMTEIAVRNVRALIAAAEK